MFYAIFNIKKKKEILPVHLLVKCEVVSPNSRYRDSGNLFPIFPYSDSLVLIFYLKCGGGLGEGGMFFLHFMLFPTFPEQKILGIKKQHFFSFNVFFGKY